MFKVNQTVVHFSHGLGVIKSIEEREFTPGKPEKFYILEIEDNGALKKVFVHFYQATERIRPIMDKAMARNVLAYIALGKPDTIDHQTWNRRYREYMELIRSGDAMQIAKVYVSLRALQVQKGLSFGERKLAEHARELLVKEFAALGIEIPE